MYFTYILIKYRSIEEKHKKEKEIGKRIKEGKEISKIAKREE